MRKIFSIVLLIVLIMGCSPSAFAGERGRYILYVNCTQNIVTVYESNEEDEYNPIKAFICSVGEGTPNGTFRTSDKYTWRLLFGDVYGQYATRITGHILFHSVPYYTTDKNDLEYDEYNKLGETASMGCVRLTVEDAKWIYDNCPSGTTVKIYESSEEEPIKKPSAMKVDVNDIEKRGWDPTDPDENNPWKKEDTITDKITEPDNINTTKTVKLYIDGREVSLEAYESDDNKYFFGGNDISAFFKLAGKDISFKNTGNIMYIKNSAEPNFEKGAKREFVSAEKGSIGVVYKSVSSQLNVYRINGEVYFDISEILPMIGIEYTEINNQLWIKTN